MPKPGARTEASDGCGGTSSVHDADGLRGTRGPRRLLVGLSPDQWQQPSLCERWRVRDVIAHVLSYDELSRWALVKRFAKDGFLPNRINAVGVAEYSSRSPEQLTELCATASRREA